MPTVTNSRNHVLVVEGVTLKAGANEISDAQYERLQKSAAFQRHIKRGWAGIRRDTQTATAAGASTATHPARADGSPLAAGTKPEEAPLDFAHNVERSKSHDRSKR